jgi:hypothetical protein
MLPSAAVEFYALQQRVNKTAGNEVARAWGRMGDNFDASWARVGPVTLAILTDAQKVMADAAAEYVPKVLAQVNLPDRPVGEFQPESLVAVASDGRRLDTLAYFAVIAAKIDVAGGAATRQALATGGSWLAMMVASQVADAARQAVGVMTAARPKLAGQVRVLNPPSCQRCAILAGRWYRWDAGFPRHPRCFPAGVTVSGPSSEAATRRWYQGELVIFSTAAGKELPVTGNHPILTDKGWIPANLLQVGDHVVSSLGGQGATALMVPDEQQTPALIEDVWRSSGMVSLGEVPTTAEDFHGDGGHGEVDVVFRDGLLGDRVEPALLELAQQVQLTRRIAETAGLGALGASDQLFISSLTASCGIMCGGGLSSSLLGAHAASAHLASLGHVSDLDTLVLQALADDVSSNPVAEAQRVLALTGSVRRRDVIVGDGGDAPRWDAPAGAFSMETRAAYAYVGQDLHLRLAGQVSLDRIVELRRVEWSGHVYNLTSSEGWYSANGLIVSNCDCTGMPVEDLGWARAEGFITDPMDAYRRGEITDLTEAQVKAIEDGANIGQVVNAYRGISTTATETRERVLQKVRHKALPPGMPDLLAFFPDRFRVTERARLLTPEGIYRKAKTRDEAIQMLRDLGYIT